MSLREGPFACEIFHKRVSYRPLMPTEKRNLFARGLALGYGYVGASFAFVFVMLLVGALGWVVDGWLHTRPLFAIVGGLLGGFAGFMALYYRVQRDTAEHKRQREREREGKGPGS